MMRYVAAITCALISTGCASIVGGAMGEAMAGGGAKSAEPTSVVLELVPGTTPQSLAQAHADENELAGEMLFGAAPLPPSLADARKVARILFAAGEHIYVGVYLKGTLATFIDGRPLHLSLFVDGINTVQNDVLPKAAQTPELLGRNSFVFDLVPDPAAMMYEWSPFAMQSSLRAITPKKHVITVRLRGQQLAFGDFALDAIGGVEKLTRDLKAAAEGTDTSRARAVKMPAAGTTDPAIEKDFADAVASQGWKSTTRKIVVTDRDWTIVRNDLTGAIIRRFFGGYVATETDAKCKLTPVSIEQIHDGAQYGKSRYSATGIGVDIDCANVK
jgi:hypothetical protein